MERRLNATETTGDPFEHSTPFQAILDTYTDGWFVEYAVDHENVTDKTTLNWKRYHNQSIQQHGELSRVLVYGMDGVLYRFNSGTAGATGYIEPVRIGIFR